MKEFYLKNIELSNFRKFDNSTYELNPRMNIFIGKNASGKQPGDRSICTWGFVLQLFRPVSDEQYSWRQKR